MAYKVFVSHSSKDRPWVEWIRANAAPTLELWLAEHHPSPGQHLADKVQRAINGSHAVIVFITDTAQASPYVQQEIGWALRARKPVIPVVQRGIAGDQLAMLEGVEYIPFDFNDPEPGRDALLRHLQSLAVKKSTDETLQMAAMLVGALLLIAVVSSSGGTAGGAGT